MSSKDKFTRRQFLKTSAIAVGTGTAAAGAIGFSPTPAAAAVPKKWNMEADVVVIGSGPTGLPAAISAVEKGASVIVLEQLKEVGGCGAINMGLLHIGGGTRVQKVNKIEDSPDLMFKRLSQYKDPYQKRNDPAMLRVFCDYNPGTLDWLEQRGVRFIETLMGGFDALHQRHPYHPIHWNKEGPDRRGPSRTLRGNPRSSSMKARKP